MKLPFFNKSINEGKVFFGLFLKERQGIGFVMKMDNSKVILLDQEKFTYANGWEHLTEEVDEVILKLEQRAKVKLHETIFFVYSHFIDDKTKEIKKVYLDKVKDLVKRLDLKALGYIESYEAVIHYLLKKEELPLTAVLIELDHSNLSVFIYKRGELTYSKVLAHTDNIIDDLLMSFTEIKGKFVLPTRIILYDSKDLDNESTDIVTHRWSEEFFLQLPRVEIMKEHELIQGMLGVFAEQYGKKSTSIATEKVQKEEVNGFVIGGDVAELKPEEKEKAPDKNLKNPQEPPVFSTAPLSNKIKELSEKIKGLPRMLGKRWTIIAGIILIILGLFLNEYFLHKATLTLLLPSRSIKKDVELTAEDLKINESVKTVELKDSKSTTGKKEIGEKAKGSVTIHNFDDSERTFIKGTSLDASGVKFVLDQEVKVASASVVTINGGLVKQPGKAKVNVTANEIGPQANLSSGKQFKIADFSNSQYFGLNESAFTGGTKKDIRTAAKKDLDDLRKNIENLAKKQKVDVPGGGENPDLKILSQLTEIDLSDENFDAEVGEEADTLNLEAQVKITSYSYSDKELKDVLIKKLAGEVEKGFELTKEKLAYTINNADKKGSDFVLDIESDAKSIKDLSVGEVVGKIRGKNVNGIEDLLKTEYKVNGYELVVRPEVPVLQNFMPFFEKNITIKISSL